MKVVAEAGRDDIALVYLAELDDGGMTEFVESLQPPSPRELKWVLTLSTLDGCPVRCRFCDAGGAARGRLTKRDILAQVDFLVRKRYPDGKVPVKKFKVQFARMGEPSLNPHVLEALSDLPVLYDAPGLIPSFSTVAPSGTDGFFDELMRLKKEKYVRSFQMQFSIHTTDGKLRDWLIPVKKWPLEKIAAYGMKFFDDEGKKITLNFALAETLPVEPEVLLRHFSPDVFLIKTTPVNPTFQAARHGITSAGCRHEEEVVGRLRRAGYQVLVSIGELEENAIGSNCGMYVSQYRREQASLPGGYTYGWRRLQFPRTDQ